MALEEFEFADGSRYELDLSNPEHKQWMEHKARSLTGNKEPIENKQVPLPAQPKKQPSFAELLKAEALTSLPGGALRGAKDVVDTGAYFLSKLGGDSERIAELNKAGKSDFLKAQELAGAGGSDITRFLGQIAATSPVAGSVGGLVGQVAPRLGQAISTFGASTGAPATGFVPKLLDMGIRSTGGLLSGGLAAGAVDPESAGTGAAIGAATPPVMGLLTPPAKYLGARGGEFLDLLRGNKGAQRIFNRVMTNRTGEANVPAVINAARNTVGATPGFRPTFAEGASQIPEASPLVTQQQITSGADKGISALFGQRKLEQDAAINAALQLRDDITGPMREAALARANQGQVNAGPVLGKIDDMLSTPGDRAVPVVRSVLRDIKHQLRQWTNRHTGVINADDLYAIRKNIGKTIGKHSKEQVSWDKATSDALEREIQFAIDDAIEKAGGTGFKQYLNEFSTRTKQTEGDLLKRELMYKPPQKTSLRGGVDVADEQHLSVPNLLSRPAMMANWLLKQVGHGADEKIDQVAAKMFLNPQSLADELEQYLARTQGTGLGGLLTYRAAPLFGATPNRE